LKNFFQRNPTWNNLQLIQIQWITIIRGKIEVEEEVFHVIRELVGQLHQLFWWPNKQLLQYNRNIWGTEIFSMNILNLRASVTKWHRGKGRGSEIGQISVTYYLNGHLAFCNKVKSIRLWRKSNKKNWCRELEMSIISSAKKSPLINKGEYS